VGKESTFMTSHAVPTGTGIASALEGLQDLDELPVGEHVARFNAVHEALTAALASIDEV
jgi:hypothetical protein